MASRSLGTLTLDVIAKVGGFVSGMDKAERSSEKWRKQVEKDAKAIGAAIGVGIGVGTAALAAMTVATVRQAGEVAKLAALSGTSNTEFQKFAAGAKSVGIEQEKLADIFKDTQDKIGDFMIAGAGPLADFFDYIAPKVGVTKEQFKGLSGPEALGLYVSSLEKANVSQAEMVFFMEAIASDASALLPLLKDGGAGFDMMGEAAERAGAIMDEKTMKAANELSASMWLVEQSSAGMKNQIMRETLPVLSDMAVTLFDMSEEGSFAQTVAEGLAGTMKWLAAAGLGVYSSFVLAGKAIGGMAAIGAAVPDGFDAIRAAGSMVANDLEQTAVELGDKINQILEAGSGAGDPDSIIKRIAAQQAAARTLLSGKGSGGTASATETDKAADALQKQIDALQLKADTVAMSAKEEELHKLALEGATEAQLLQAAAALDVVAAWEKKTEALKKTQEEQKRVNEEAKSIAESLLSEEEAILASYERRRQIILDNTEVTGAAQTELLKKLEQKRNEDLLQINGDFWDRWLAAADENLTNLDDLAGGVLDRFSASFGDAFEAMVFDAETLGDAVSGMAEGMARSVVNAIGQMVAQWLAYQVVQLMVGKSTQASAVTAMTANASASALQAGINAYASTAAIPIVGPVAAPAAMAAALSVTVPMATAVGSMALAGMAHDGIDAVPETGTWLLEKGERVTTEKTSAKLDRTLDSVAQNQRSGAGGTVVNLFEDASRAGQVSSTRGADGREQLDVFVANIRQQGQMAKVLEQTYGLKRAGR